MKRGLWLLIAGVLLSGCITERRVAFSSPPGPLALSGELAPAPLERRWALGEVFVSASQNGSQQQFDDWRKGRAQLEARLKETLARQPNLGVRVEDRASADYLVDLQVELHETRAINAWMAPALVSEVAAMAVVLGTGTLIGRALSPADRDQGAIIGLTVALVPAIGAGIAAPLAFPTNEVIASADAKLTFRRASDGVVILEKHARAEWNARFNSYGIEERLATITGEGAQSLEKEIVAALSVGLRSAPATVSRALPEDAPLIAGTLAQ